MTREEEKFRERLNAEGPTAVRHKLESAFYSRPRQRDWATEWLREQENAEAAATARDRRDSWRFNLIMVILGIIAIAVAIMAAR